MYDKQAGSLQLAEGLSIANGKTPTKHKRFDYQSVRHCSKTGHRACPPASLLDYQSVRHCSKTEGIGAEWLPPLDYQSVRHCSKTSSSALFMTICWITSQFDTAPKRL